MRRRIYDTIFLCCLLTLCVSLPINYFIDDPVAIKCISLILRLALLLYFYWTLKRNGTWERGFSRPHGKHLLILSPVFVSCFVTGVYYLLRPEYFYNGFNNLFYFDLGITILTAINEELLFRLVIHNSLSIRNRLVKIIASAGIFAAFHLLNFIGSFNPFVLMDVAYAFAIGVVAGFFMEYTHSVIPGMIFHFLFNLINSNFVTYFVGGIDYVYYIVGASMAVVVGLYLLFVYLFYFKKKEFFY